MSAGCEICDGPSTSECEPTPSPSVRLLDPASVRGWLEERPGGSDWFLADLFHDLCVVAPSSVECTDGVELDGSFTAAARGDGEICGLQADGAVVCASVEVDIEDATALVMVDAGHPMGCAIRASGVTTCWTHEEVWDATESYSSLLLSGARLCGIVEGGRVACETFEGDSVPPPLDGPMTRIEGVDGRMCGATDGGELVCVPADGLPGPWPLPATDVFGMWQTQVCSAGASVEQLRCVDDDLELRVSLGSAAAGPSTVLRPAARWVLIGNPGEEARILDRGVRN